MPSSTAARVGDNGSKGLDQVKKGFERARPGQATGTDPECLAVLAVSSELLSARIP